MWPPRFLPSSCATLSRWRPRLTLSTTHMWRIETLMELAVLLRELLLCSFPNGEKFNYQLICCVVSSDMKFPIVSTSIKRSASAQLFRHWEQRTQVDAMSLPSDVAPCVPPTHTFKSHSDPVHVHWLRLICTLCALNSDCIILFCWAPCIKFDQICEMNNPDRTAHQVPNMHLCALIHTVWMPSTRTIKTICHDWVS